MRRHIFTSIVAAALTALSSPARAGTDWYVATNGSDANAGTAAMPWLTIQHAVAFVQPGDTVHVADGTYAGWATDVAGTSSAPITWVADGANVVVDRPCAGGPGNPADNIRLMYADWNVVDGFHSIHAPRAGISPRGDDVTPITGCVVRNCVCDANQTWGIFDAFANQCTYEDNVCSNSVDQHGIYHSNSGDDGVIRRNRVFDNFGNGIHLNGDASQGGDGVISRMVIEGNVIHGNGRNGGGGINMDGVQDSTIQDNLLYDNHASGIIGYQIDAADAAKNDVIANNTVIMADDSRWALKLVDGSTGCTVFGNVLYRNHAFRGSLAIDAASLPGFTSDWNVVVDRFSTDGDSTKISLATWQSTTGQDQHSILIDATQLDQYFADPNNNDWHLASGSPALDASVASLAGHPAPTLDFEGNARPQDGGFDIGCDEHRDAAAANYGTGWTGTFGVPSLGVSTPPRLGVAFDLLLGNSAGANTVALLAIGTASASIPTNRGGTILVLPLVWQLVSVPSGGATLSSGALDDPALGGAEAFLQQLQLDAGASKGVSFSEGLDLVVGD
jgi:parallel beta-helix repeat protein